VLDEHEKPFLPIRFASQQQMEEDGDGFQLDFLTVLHLIGRKLTSLAEVSEVTKGEARPISNSA
jgi:hypothetical protein